MEVWAQPRPWPSLASLRSISHIDMHVTRGGNLKMPFLLPSVICGLLVVFGTVLQSTLRLSVFADRLSAIPLNCVLTFGFLRQGLHNPGGFP